MWHAAFPTPCHENSPDLMEAVGMNMAGCRDRPSSSSPQADEAARRQQGQAKAPQRRRLHALGQGLLPNTSRSPAAAAAALAAAALAGETQPPEP